jgi:prophage regulatory protein
MNDTTPKAKQRSSGALPETLHPEQRLHFPQVMTLAGHGRTWIYDKIADGRFPAPERDGPRCSRWRAGDVLEWLQARRDASKAAT